MVYIVGYIIVYMNTYTKILNIVGNVFSLVIYFALIVALPSPIKLISDRPVRESRLGLYIYIYIYIYICV